MFRESYSKNVIKFIKNNDEEGLNEYILKNIARKASAYDLEFLDGQYSYYQGVIERRDYFFQTFINLGWIKIIRSIFDKTSYIPGAIHLNCREFKLDRSMDRAVAFHLYITKLNMSGVFKTTSNVVRFNVQGVDYPFYSLSIYEKVVNQRINKHEENKREYAYTDYFEFIACYQSALNTDEIKSIFEAINPSSKKESIFFLKFPNIFFQGFALSNQNNFSKIYEGLLHYGDEKWIKSNYMKNVFEIHGNTEKIPFKNYEQFKNIFHKEQAEKTKNVSYNKMTKKSTKKTYPIFHNPKKGVIVIEKGSEFININFLDVTCTIKDCGDMISIYSSPNTYNIQEDDFKHKEDFEKIRNYIFNTLRGLDVDFPDFKKEVSLSIEHH
jgi:hypothetical protein